MQHSPALRESSITYLTGSGVTSPRPSSVGQKFDEHGTVLRFPGNTFICHIPQNSLAHYALAEASETLQSGTFAGAFSFLPPSSFHMTVFEGVADANRNVSKWPTSISNDAAIEVVTQQFQSSTVEFELPAKQLIRPTGIFGGFSVAVTGLTAEDENSLRRNRKMLRDMTGIHADDFADYQFHITLAYLLRWLTVAEAEAVMDLSNNVFERMHDRCPQIALGGVEFCTFENMHAFKPIRVLSGGHTGS